MRIVETETAEVKKKKWYQTTGGIIALLILFFPAGLYLMWKHAGWSKKVKWGITGVFAVLFLIAALTDSSKPSDKSQGKTSPSTTQPTQAVQQQTVQATQAPTKKPEPTKDTSQHELDADIRFSEVAYQITNNEGEDWTDCKFEMNSGLFSGGYVYRLSLFPAKEVIIVPFREFTKGDGTRFNPEATKHQNISVSCDVGDDLGFNYFETK